MSATPLYLAERKAERMVLPDEDRRQPRYRDRSTGYERCHPQEETALRATIARRLLAGSDGKQSREHFATLARALGCPRSLVYAVATALDISSAPAPAPPPMPRPAERRIRAYLTANVVTERHNIISACGVSRDTVYRLAEQGADGVWRMNLGQP